MHRRLDPGSEAADAKIGVAVTSQQEDLEKQHGGGLDCGSAAEPGQDILRNQGLHLKEKERAGKDRYGIGQHARWRGTCLMGHGKRLSHYNRVMIRKGSAKRAFESFSLYFGAEAIR